MGEDDDILDAGGGKSIQLVLQGAMTKFTAVRGTILYSVVLVTMLLMAALAMMKFAEMKAMTRSLVVLVQILFVFRPGFGNDVVTDFNKTEDTLIFYDAAGELIESSQLKRDAK